MDVLGFTLFENNQVTFLHFKTEFVRYRHHDQTQTMFTYLCEKHQTQRLYITAVAGLSEDHQSLKDLAQSA